MDARIKSGHDERVCTGSLACGIIVGDKPNLAIAIAPNYIWIKETMEKLSGS